MIELTVIVQPSPNCVDVLKYIDTHIRSINALSVHIDIIRVEPTNKSALKKLRDSGIKYLPALTNKEGKIYVGKEDIISLFERNLGKGAAPPARKPMTDVSQYWDSIMYDDVNGKRGKPKSVSDEREDDTKDIETKLADYRKKAPKHRQTQPAEAEFNTRRDNVYDDDDDTEAYAPRPADTGTNPDDEMMAAWLENNVGNI
jgi:hypothetical protein